jgi:hypothetical protein
MNGEEANGAPRSLRRVLFFNRHGLLRVSWRLAIVLLVAAALSVAFTLLSVPVVSLLQERGGPEGFRGVPISVLLAGYLLTSVALYAASALLLFRFDRRPVAGLGLGLHEAWKHDLGIGFLLGAAVTSATVGALALSGSLAFGGAELGAARAARMALLHFALFAGVALSEELIFRGYFLQVLAEGIGKVPASLALSAGFGLIHLANEGGTPAGALATGAAGLLLSLAYFRTRSLWLPIGVHLGWNFFLGWVYSLPISGETLPLVPFRCKLIGPEWMTGGTFGPEAGAPAFIGMGVLAVFLARWRGLRVSRRAEEWCLPPEERCAARAATIPPGTTSPPEAEKTGGRTGTSC